MQNPRVEFLPFQYDPQKYNAEIIRGIDLGPRPYDIHKEILSRMSHDGILLDVGCGSAKKLLPLAPYIKTIIGIDNNPAVIAEALKKIRESGIQNIHLAQGEGNNLSFPSESIDMISYMLCPHNSREAIRVLKKGGYIIIDRVGEQDKLGIKKYFTDEKGKPRGYRSDMFEGEIRWRHDSELKEAGFNYANGIDMLWQTSYTREGLWQLLNSTKTISNFNPEQDKETFDYACDKLTTSDGIVLTQHRVFVVAQK